MPKNVELLDNANDILYPRTLAEQVNVSTNKTLNVKLNEIDTEINKRLPLTGGTLTGDLTVNAITTFGGNVLHDGGNITISSVPNSFLYSIYSHQRGTVKIGSLNATDSIITTDTPQLTVKDFLTINNEDVQIYRADHQAGWRIGSSQNGYSYIAPVSNGNALWNEGIRYQEQRTYRGETYQNTLILSTNVQPLLHGIGDLGGSTACWNQVWTVNGVQQTSDGTQKEDIRQVQDEEFFNMIKDVEVKSYLYKEPVSEVSTLELIDDEDKEPRTQDNVEDNDLNVGIIAQDMAKHDVSKYVLHHSDESGYSINLYNYSASLHSALRHEIKKREELEERVAKLEEIISKQATTLL